MATHILLAYTECVPGTDDAFNAWRGPQVEAPA